jgi:RNA recognition motif-containing protein
MFWLLDNSIKGFAYIEFESAEDAEEAIYNMHDSELYNRVIKVDVAKPHRGLAGLDNSLPGIVLISSILMCSVATGGMDQGEYK